MKWIDDAGFIAKRLWSVRMAAIGVVWASAGSAWLVLPPEWRPDIPAAIRVLLAVIGVMLASAPGIAALVHQPKLAAKIEKRQDSARGVL